MDTTSRCLDAITDSLDTIGDPARLSSVHDWVVKLTSGEPSAVKTDYLRLLEYALKSGGGVREPFSRPPPDGPLMAGLGRPRARTDGVRGTCALAAGGGGICCSDDDEDDDGDDDDDGQDRTTLQEFVADARRYTRDGGRLMARAADETLRDFRRTTAAAFRDRTLKLGDALAKEQAGLLLRYRAAGQRAFSRAQILLDHVRELMPTFQYDRYAAAPDEHVAAAIGQRAEFAPPTRCDAVRGDNDAAAADDKDDDDDDEDGGGGGGAQRKKMMCALNWLRSEVDRADCENATLGQRYAAVVAAIGEACKRKLAEECRAEELKRDARTELDELRKRSAKQVALIDCYVERIGSCRKQRAGSDGGPTACQ